MGKKESERESEKETERERERERERGSGFSTQARGQQNGTDVARVSLTGFPPQTYRRSPSFSALIRTTSFNSREIKWKDGVRRAEQRGSRTRKAAQTPVAATQDSHTDQTALQLGQRTLPVPQPDAGETPTRAEKAPHVLAHLGETVTFLPSQLSQRRFRRITW